MASIITVGRRKTAVARVKLTEGSGKVTVNKKDLEKYFPIDLLREEVLRPFLATSTKFRPPRSRPKISSCRARAATPPSTPPLRLAT